MKKKHYGKKKRTISPEHLAKMQAGRARARIHRARMSELDGLKLPGNMPVSMTEKMLDSVRGRRVGK